jgi:AcrR family transcriptional regulator
MDEKQTDIMRAAVRLFSEKGYNSTSVEEIAKASGMAKGSFYKHFSSKEDLVYQICALIPKRIETELVKVYGKVYRSDYEKLVDFLSICIETVLANQLHLLMTIFDLPLFKNRKMNEAVECTIKQMNTWNKEFLLELYGPDIEDYVGDLIFLLKGCIIEYVHTSQHHDLNVDGKKAAAFIAAMLDIVVQGLMERKPEPFLSIEALGGEIHAEADSPLLRAQKIQLLLRQMEYTVKNLKTEADVEEEYLQTLSLLGEESANKKPKSFLLKALIEYLQKVPELQEDCEKLKELLKLQQAGF